MLSYLSWFLLYLGLLALLYCQYLLGIGTTTVRIQISLCAFNELCEPNVKVYSCYLIIETSIRVMSYIFLAQIASEGIS